jgi:hypothetical protein
MLPNPDTAPAVTAMRATADYLEAKGIGGDYITNAGYGEQRKGLVTLLRAEAQKLETQSATWQLSSQQLVDQRQLLAALDAVTAVNKSPLDGVRVELRNANLLARAERGERISVYDIDQALEKAEIPWGRRLEIKQRLGAAGVMVYS